MARPRKYTAHVGCQLTEGEFEAFKRYLEDRELTATEFFRKEILKPLLQRQAQEGRGDDRPAA